MTSLLSKRLLQGMLFSGCKLSILVLLYSVLYFVIPALYGCFYLAFYILSVLGCISVLGFVLPLSQNLDCISVFGLGFSIFEFCSFWFLSATVYIWWSSASKSKHWKQLNSVEHVLIRPVARSFTGRCDPRRRRTKRVRNRRSKSLGVMN